MNTKNLRTEHRNGQMIPTVYELGWWEKTWQSFKQLDCWFSTRYGFRKASNEGYCTKPKLRKSNIAVENLKDHCPPEISHSSRKIHGLVQFIYIYIHTCLFIYFLLLEKKDRWISKVSVISGETGLVNPPRWFFTTISNSYLMWSLRDLFGVFKIPIHWW